MQAGAAGDPSVYCGDRGPPRCFPQGMPGQRELRADARQEATHRLNLMWCNGIAGKCCSLLDRSALDEGMRWETAHNGGRQYETV
eukprot:13573157-Alexandrium_andersonii.AAC.2